MADIRAVLTGVEQKLNENVVGTYPDGVSFGFGLVGDGENTAPPRIVWQPTEWTDEPARGAGGNPKPLATHAQQIEATVWAATFDATEDLLKQLKRALIEQCSAASVSLSLLGGRWKPDRNVDHGWAAVQRFAVKSAVTNAALPVTNVTNVGHTTGFEGSAELGCSS